MSSTLISNAREYMYTKKYVSIHSEDRDIKKYPNSALFTIELPQDYVNVVTIKLESWSFPSNYSTFSVLNNNITMSFQINVPYVYTYGTTTITDTTIQVSYAVTQLLQLNKNHIYSIIIDDGFYNPDQMSNELTNRFNNSVTLFITDLLTQNIGSPIGDIAYGVIITSDMITLFNSEDYGGYTDFIIIYHSVSQKLFFGNTNSGFIIPSNNASLTNLNYVLNTYDYKAKCEFKSLPDYSNYGLVSNLGFSLNINTSIKTTPLSLFYLTTSQVTGKAPVLWLTPDLIHYPIDPSTTTIPVSYFMEPMFKINVMGPSHIYLELEGLNNIDETSPFDDTYISETTNFTNSRVNSAFAKIPISSTPISQWYDHECKSFKLYNPPAERIRKLKIRLRYHDGLLAVFGVFNYTFTLEFTMLTPQQLKNFTTLYPNNIY